jgi:4-diphosphocytidyl-2-C-methyl-D-erythritol kinase
MIAFANCKINLGLHVVEKRADGYHNLDTVFYPVKNVYDVLEIKESAEFKLQQSGLIIKSPLEKNLVFKAYQLLKTHYDLPNIEIHLHKTIPSGAGLGGGSADASFMLLLLNNYFNLQITKDSLSAFALQLGSDCPFFIENECCTAQGRGELLSPINLDLAGLYLYLIKPPIHVSTAQAFAGIIPAAKETILAESIMQPKHTWKNTISNDFEKTIFALHPQFASIKEKLYDAGALYASMSGTGSTIYGIFEKEVEIDVPKDWWSGCVEL